MTRRDWWLGIGVVALALLTHAAFPRYDWRQASGVTFVRIDRWTGRVERGAFFDSRGWTSLAQREAETQALKQATSDSKPGFVDEPLPSTTPK